jgi:hypothetical protein
MKEKPDKPCSGINAASGLLPLVMLAAAEPDLRFFVGKRRNQDTFSRYGVNGDRAMGKRMSKALVCFPGG